MSRYSRYQGECGVRAKPYKAPTPAKPFAYKVTGGKAARARYEDCHLHWRAGLIDSWYYGRRSPSDPTIVWEINGHEIGFDEISKLLKRQRDAYQVSSLYWGENLGRVSLGGGHLHKRGDDPGALRPGSGPRVLRNG